MSWFVGPSLDIFVITFSQQPFVRNKYYFTRMNDTKPSCAYCQHAALELLLNELWPFDLSCMYGQHFSLHNNLVNTTLYISLDQSKKVCIQLVYGKV